MVRSDEIWLWHSGGPLTLLIGDSPAITLGPDLSAGQLPHCVVPGGTWQSARPATDAEVLVSCVVAPGFDFTDFTA
jgi:predicted cupin superfamily sugar epimerase